MRPNLISGSRLRDLRPTRSRFGGGRGGRLRLPAIAAGGAAAIAILTTCEAATGPRANHVVLTYIGDTSLTAGAHVPVGITVTVGGAPYNNPRLSFHSSDTTVLGLITTPTGADSLVARGLGTATLTTELVSSVLVGPQPTITTIVAVGPRNVQFSRPTLTLGSLGDTITVPAQAFDQQDVEIANVTFIWSTSDTTVARVTTKGRITAIANGAATIRAVIGPDTASLPVTVQQKLAHFVISPALPLTMDAFGEDSTVTATGRDSLGSVMTGAAGAPTWGLQSVGIVTVDPAGRVQSVGNGSTYLYATQSPIRDSLLVTVAQRATRIVVTAPTGLVIPAIGGTLVLTASAFDRNNNPIAPAVPTLTSLDPGIAQVNSPTRTVTGIAAGAARIVATQDLTADTVLVQVANIPVKLSLSVDTVVLNSVGDTLKIGVTFTNSLGGTVTGLVPTWYSSDTTLLSVATQDGRVVAVRQGTARVIAAYASLSDTALITVTNAPASIHIVNRADTLPSLGDTLVIAATILNTRGVALPPGSVAWSADNQAVATVSSVGTVTSHTVGRTTVRATSGILADSAAVWVTNNPRHIILNSHLDTLTARGLMLVYTAIVTNQSGQTIVGDTITWQSTSPGVASVNSAGLVTALGTGSTRVIARTATIADTAIVVVRTPTLLYVDNSTLDTLFFGTLKRPFAHIQDGVVAASPGDTVFVKVGVGPYSESVALSRDIVLMGDPAAYRAAGNDPTKLPLISHDTGAAGITAITSARILIRTLAIRHTLDGPALFSHGASIAVSNLYVNPSGDPFNSGRGLWIDSTSNANLDSNKVQNVKAFGIKLHKVNNGSVTRSSVFTVNVAETGTTSAGVEVDYGSNNVISGDLVQWTYGPEILLDSTAAVTATGNSLFGATQLMRLLAVTGNSRITSNTFNTFAQSNDLNLGNSQTDGRSGLELNLSPGVVVAGNSFTGDTGSRSLTDALRFIGTRGSAGPALLQQNQFSGGRFAIRSETSTWILQFSNIHGNNVGIVLSNADTATLATDTVTTAVANCVQATGTGIHLVVTGGYYAACGPARNAAIEMNAPGGSVDVNSGATFVGAGQRGIEVNGGHHAAVVGNFMVGGAPGGTVNGFTLVGVIDLQADSVTVVGNSVTGYPSYAALSLDGTNVRADSNFLSRNRVGIQAGVLGTVEASSNDIFDNDSAGVVNEQAAGVSIPNNWWGDSLGPRSFGVPMAVGDSVVGPVSLSPVGWVPLNMGIRAAAPLRKVYGDQQSAKQSTPLPQPLAVRVVDELGRPVPGVSVTFTVTPTSGGSGTTLTGGVTTLSVGTNSSGLAKTTVTLGTPGTYSVSASNQAAGTVVFTVTATN